MKLVRSLTAFIAVLALSIDASAQVSSVTGAAAPRLCKVAQVIAKTCGPELNGLRIVVDDGADATECGNPGDTGLGAFENFCAWSVLAAAWVSDEPDVGAPTTADYLVGTADAGLSAEIVVGTTPGGDLGGTWAAPTVTKVVASAGPDLRTISTATCPSGFYIDLDSDSAFEPSDITNPESCVGGSQLFYATDYASGSNTGGIQEAIDAVAATSEGCGTVQLPWGVTTIDLNVVTTGIVVGRCTFLQGYGMAKGNFNRAGTRIFFNNEAGDTGITFNENMSGMRDVVLRFPANNDVSTIGIKVQHATAATIVSGFVLERVFVEGGNVDLGVGIQLNGVIASLLNEVWTDRWDTGLQVKNRGASVKTNALACVSCKFTGSLIGVEFVSSDGVSKVSESGAFFGGTIEQNDIGIQFNDAADIVVQGVHFENRVGCTDLFDTGGPPQTSGSPDGLCDSDAVSFTGTNVLIANDDEGMTYTSFGNSYQGGVSAGRDIVRLEAGLDTMVDISTGDQFKAGVKYSGANSEIRIHQRAFVSIAATFTGASVDDENMTFDGATIDAFKTTLAITDPTAARTTTVPDADTTIHQPLACTNQFARSSNAATGAFTCAGVADADIVAGAAIQGTKINVATEAVRGVLQIATQAETDLVLADNVWITPLKLGNFALAGGDLGGDLDTPTVTDDSHDHTNLTGTTSLTWIIDSDKAGTEPATGAGLHIEGGSGDLTALYNATSNIWEFAGAAGGYDFDGGVFATSFEADPSTLPALTMKDSDMGGTPDINIEVLGNCPTGTTATNDEDCDLAFRTQAAGTLTEAFRIDTADDGTQTVPFVAKIFSDDIVVDGILDLGTVETFGNPDTTPDVDSGIYWTTNTVNNTITDFDPASHEDGRIVVVLASDGGTVLDCTGVFLECGTTDITMAANDIATFIFTGTNWTLIAYVDQADDLGTDATGSGSLGSELTSTTNDITTSNAGDLLRLAGAGESFDIDFTTTANEIGFSSATAVGVFDFGTINLEADQLESDIVTGTAPLIIASTTLVANLNADTVDGINLSTIIQDELDELATIGATVISATNWTNLAALLGTNTGDEPAADLTTPGIIEIATGAETNTGTDATRAVSPDGLDDWTGSTALAAGTETLTNKTLDVEATGNVVTIVDEEWYDFVGCPNATAALNWDTEAGLTAPAIQCVDNGGTTQGQADFDDASAEGFQRLFKLPATWTGNIDVDLYWRGANTTLDVCWVVQTACTAVGEVWDGTFTAAGASDTVSDTAAGTTLQLNLAAFSSITTTGCAASELMHLRVKRDGAEAETQCAAGSDDFVGDALGVGLEITMRRAL